jgi:branched-chain amino acid transport system ATP-binding protein
MTTQIKMTAESRGSGDLGPGLHVKGLCAGYGKALVLQNLDLFVPEGQVVAVVGPNGAGKSTLVKSISGVLKPRGGSVRFRGETLSGMAPHQIARRGVLHVAETRDIFGGMTVWENLKVAFDNLNDQANIKQAFDEVYALFPILHEFRGRVAGNLSGGQQQMLAIARALLGRPKLLMLDEPSLGLASLIIREIYVNLERLRGSGLTVLLVEQNAKMAVNFADYSVVLANGAIVLEGTRDELAGNDNLIHHYLGGTARAIA